MVELTASQKALIGYMGRSDKHAVHGFSLILKSEDPKRFFSELRNAGMFEPATNPGPQEVEGKAGFFRIPIWPALEYLVCIAGIAGETADVTLGSELMEIVRALSAENQGRAPADNYHTNAALVEIISLVPTECVSLEDVDLAEGWLKTKWGNSTIVSELDKAIGRFLAAGSTQDREKAVRLLWHCTELGEVQGQDRNLRDRRPVADSYWLGQLLEHRARDMGRIAKDQAVDCLLARLREVFSDEFMADSSWLSRPAIEEHDQNHSWDDTVNAYVDAARDSLDAWLHEDPESAKVYVARMLSDDAQIVRRLAINAVRNHWNSLQSEFEAAISQPLFEIGHLHELHWLLRDHYRDLTAEAKARVHDVIVSLVDGKDPGSREMELAQRSQRDWLYSIQGLGDAQVDATYARIVEVAGPIRDHPDFLAYHESWIGSGPSPYTPEEIATFADDGSLVKRIDAYDPPADERSGSRKSLIDALSNAVAAKPRRLIQVLGTREQVSRRIQYGLLNGFLSLVEKQDKEDAPDNFRELLDAFLPYMEALICDPGFWGEPAEVSDDFEPNKDWIPPIVGRISKKLAASDAVPLSDANIEQLTNAVSSIMTHAPGIEMPDDPMTAAINNARGMAVEALLQILLRRCRDADKATQNHQSVWDEMRPTFEAELAECMDGQRLESSTLFGTYFAQIHYVDIAWVRANMERLFPFDQETNLSCAIVGLAYANFSPRVYESLKGSDVPRKALRLVSLRASARERLIERIAVAYLWGQEELDSPCIAEMFSPDRLDDVVELVATAVTWSRSKLKDDHVQRVKALARRSVAFGMEDPKSRANLLAIASRFIQFVDSPEDEIEWLVPVARYAHQSHWDSDFLDTLAEFVDRDPERTKQLLDAFLEEYRFSYDYRDKLKTVIRKLHAAGLRQDALRIVSSVVEKGAGPSWTAFYNELVEQ